MEFLKEGDIVELKEGHKVYTEVPQHYLYENRKGNWKTDRGVVGINNGTFEYLVGKYVVIHTSHDGGGSCSDGVGYPDGYHVYCEKIVKELDTPIKVDFYQSGHFTTMIKDIKPIGKAKLKFEYEIKE